VTDLAGIGQNLQDHPLAMVTDPDAVVDVQLRVHGVAGLRATVLAIAERGAALIAAARIAAAPLAG
jgi:hypothetical protein